MDSNSNSGTKTLYISDMDGTLLTPAATLSDFTRDTLNELIGRGLHFTVATARTAATAGKILAGVDLRIPAVTMNGVALYDFARKRTLHTRRFSPETARGVVEVIRSHRLAGFLYAQAGETLTCFFEQGGSAAARAFMEKRREDDTKRVFTQVAFSEILDRDLIYYSNLDRYDLLAPAYAAFSRLPGLHADFYRDVYSEEYWYLELSSAEASKYNGVQDLKTMLGFARVVGFGDNLNDLPLFAACDEAYAVAGAKDELKARATAVIGANTEDAVAHWLRSRAVL